MGRGKFLRSLRQRWWMLALIVVPVTLFTFAFAEFLTPTMYEGFVTVADRRDRDINIASLYPEQALGGGVNEQEVRVINLANTAGSYTVLKAAFDELTGLGILKERGPAAQRAFFRDVEIRPARGSEFLTIAFISKNLDDSKKVIETITSKLISHYSNLNTQRADAQVKFVEEQLKEQKAIYAQKLQEQQEFMEEYPEAAGFDVNTSGLVQRYNQARSDLHGAERAIAVAQETLRVARQFEGDPMMVPNPMKVDNLNPLYMELERRINTTETSLIALRERFGPNHPSIIALTKSLEEDKETFKNTQKYVQTFSEYEVGEIERLRMQSIFSAEQSLQAARAEKARAQVVVNELKAQLDRLPVVQKELLQYQAEIKALAESVANLTQKLEESKVRAAQNAVRGLYFLDDPQVQEVDRKTLLKTLIAFFLSSVVAISLIASLGQFDQSTYTPLDAENSLGFPVLAALPKSGQQRLNPDVEQPTPLAASYQILSTQIAGIKEKLNGPGILVSAAEPDSGRTTVAANLAISLARDGSRVLIVDADLRNPSLHEHFGIENRAGISEVLSGQATIEQVVQSTGVDGLLFISAGQIPVNPVRMLRGGALDAFIEQVGKGVDFIIFDSPAGSTFGDPLVLAEHVQNVILVHEAGRAATGAEYDFHKSLERLGVNIIGLVLNKTRPEDCPSYQHFRRNYQSAINRYHALAGRTALGPGEQPKQPKPRQFGRTTGTPTETQDDDEE